MLFYAYAFIVEYNGFVPRTLFELNKQDRLERLVDKLVGALNFTQTRKGASENNKRRLVRDTITETYCRVGPNIII